MARRAKEDKSTKLDDMQGFGEEFGNETDRAFAILGAALLDECLRELIAGFLIDDSGEVDEVLGVERPLGSFSSRVRASYCMGLISELAYHDLKVVNKIRNRFAHDLHGLSFDSQQIADMCGALRVAKGLTPWGGLPLARCQYHVSVAFLAVGLRTSATEVEAQRRVVPKQFALPLKGH